MGKHFAYTINVQRKVIHEYNIVVVARNFPEARILAATRDGFVCDDHGEDSEFVFTILEKDGIDNDLQEIMDDLMAGEAQ